MGEIDIVARKGRVLVVIEVKARVSRELAAEAITPRQRDRISRAAAAYLAQNPRLADLGVRFDTMLLTPRRLPAHIVDAWRV